MAHKMNSKSVPLFIIVCKMLDEMGGTWLAWGIYEKCDAQK